MKLADAIRAAVKSGGSIDIEQLHAGVEALLEKAIARKKVSDNAYQLSRAGDVAITGTGDDKVYSVGSGKPQAAKRKSKPPLTRKGGGSKAAKKKKPAPKTIKEIADAFAAEPQKPLLLRHIESTLNNLAQIAENYEDDADLRRALDMHREAVQLAGVAA